MQNLSISAQAMVQKIKIHNFTLSRLLIVKFVKKMVYLGAHYSERQELMGWHNIDIKKY